ncbi:30S ribosomal protein S6 [Candidatus Woesebacteria bacterium]|nr:30S ribosomal protein S6 [Candidatus Woesebacteria bacterium]
MQNYELTVVLPGKASANKKKKTKDFIEELVKTLEGKVKKSDEWGVIDLAYRIKKSEKGLFLYFKLEMEPTNAKQLDDKLRIEEDIIRYLLIKSDK